jgi:hypothetical protein
MIELFFLAEGRASKIVLLLRASSLWELIEIRCGGRLFLHWLGPIGAEARFDSKFSNPMGVARNFGAVFADPKAVFGIKFGSAGNFWRRRRAGHYLPANRLWTPIGFAGFRKLSHRDYCFPAQS